MSWTRDDPHSDRRSLMHLSTSAIWRATAALGVVGLPALAVEALAFPGGSSSDSRGNGSFVAALAGGSGGGGGGGGGAWRRRAWRRGSSRRRCWACSGPRIW
ncbi:hypothetical protein SAMD00023353_7000100 [Rosellinia necatrix]|uniref:Uncharacterized protein n=1 Tax=Rosellinia necatrix TaxID=77044 RepID=A0A1S8ABM6_ROSNE|nr:hypothetical protein SAMD00023353_7000100 [Rosellinia necatrix]